MRLHSPQSAILSAVIFNALIIVALIPLAMRGVRYRPVSARRLLRRNLLIYGLGGIVAPFVGIKIIDLVLVGLGLGCCSMHLPSLRQLVTAVRACSSSPSCSVVGYPCWCSGSGWLSLRQAQGSLLHPTVRSSVPA